jgi:hypothetical protein
VRSRLKRYAVHLIGCLLKFVCSDDVFEQLPFEELCVCDAFWKGVLFMRYEAF